MAIALDSQKALRPIRDLPFCYMCTHQFHAGDDIDRDHIPPYKLFAKGDRNFPLILPTHKQCNSGWSAEDQVISQLVGMLHGRDTHEKDRKMRIVAGKFPDGSPAAGLLGVDLPKIIRRWIRGFHAALYREPLPDKDKAVFMTASPLPQGRVRGTEVDFVSTPKIRERIVEEIKKNRLTNSLDQIISRNGQCRYECVWVQFDKGEWFCVYALDIYDWKDLGDVTHFGPHGCVGCYRRPQKGTPASATCATKLHFIVQNKQKLDPFGC